MPIFFVIFASFLLSMKGVFAKLAFAAGATVDASLFYRFAISLPLVWLFLIYKKKLHYLKKSNPSDFFFILALSFFGYYIGSKADYIALQWIGAGISRMILFTYPVFVVILNSLIKIKIPNLATIGSMLFCQLGLFLILGAYSADLLDVNFYGATFSFISALAYAFYIVLLSQRGGKIDSQYLVALVVSFAFGFIALDFSLTNKAAELSLNQQAFFWCVMMAIFSTALPLTLFAEAVKKIGANNSAIISTVSPVFTLVIAFIVLNEKYSLWQLVGAAIIIISIYYLSQNKNKQQRQMPN